MNKARDLIALAILAYRNGKLDGAAKFFASAMESEGLDSFVDEIARNVPRAALTGLVPSSDNTLSPSLASTYDLDEIIESVEAVFRAECSLLDDEEEEVEARASDEEQDSEDVSATEELHITASAGPVSLK